MVPQPSAVRAIVMCRAPKRAVWLMSLSQDSLSGHSALQRVGIVIHIGRCDASPASLVPFPLLQVKKLSWEDGGLYHRQLYMRNVGSTASLPKHDGTLDTALPPPSRVAGDIISFKRCTTLLGVACC